MRIYTYTEARQKLASLLEQAAKYGEYGSDVAMDKSLLSSPRNAKAPRWQWMGLS
jgi:hypothetical protein